MSTKRKRKPAFEELSPHFAQVTQDVAFGQIWERPGLSKRDRSLITVAALTVLYRTNQLRGHLHRALDNGLNREEIIEAIEHLAIYGGWPVAVNAFEVAREVFDQRQVEPLTGGA